MGVKNGKDKRGAISLARRLYLHLSSGGIITAKDMGRIIEGMEKTDAETARLRAILEKAVALYGQPGGPWNVPSEPGTWLAMAKEALGVVEGTAEEVGEGESCHPTR